MELHESVVIKEMYDSHFLKKIYQKNIEFKDYLHRDWLLSNVGLQLRHLQRVGTILTHFVNCNTILDVGCGYADILLDLSKKGKYMVGIDIDAKRIAIAKLRLKKHSLQGEFVLADAQKLPFKSKVFDLSFSNQVIEHVAAPRKLIREMLRTSKRIATIHSNQKCLLRLLYVLLKHHRLPDRIPEIGKFRTEFINCVLPVPTLRLAKLSEKIIGNFPLLRMLLAGNVIEYK